MIEVAFKGIIGKCNKHCTHCAVPEMTTSSELSEENVRKFLKLNEGYHYGVSFLPYGEVTLLPEIYDILEEVSHQHTLLNLTTNLDMDYTDDQLQTLSKFNAILVDVSASSDLARNISNVKRVASLNPTCHLEVTIVYRPFADNGMLPSFVREKPLYVADEYVMNLIHGVNGVKFAKWRAKLPNNKDEMIHYAGDYKTAECTPYALHVSNDGSASFCAIDLQKDTFGHRFIGNAFEESIEKLLAKEEVKYLLAMQKEGRLMTKELCRKCPHRVMYGSGNVPAIENLLK